VPSPQASVRCAEGRKEVWLGGWSWPDLLRRRFVSDLPLERFRHAVHDQLNLVKVNP
jgi:hypothetical protein